ncbi:lipopolysaccharide-induced tumor necrosis factor-alpha factor homolog [Spodoptera frugiperda]|uniref:Lipopolysaccharide-induced tumor necrosis factor-alpha factor homolog n=1 Tax=Spodoptera frugiperda TaxID=7108 RepID=A0A2H1VQH2_SPOFR|nr:lipopolysaccharide-induced tumor necrosis factor-alpha factor homolog [Spodoptera frugiperda]
MNTNEMLENQEQLYDPKGLGRPPPYTEFATPPPPVIVHQPQVSPVPIPEPVVVLSAVPVVVHQPQVSPTPIPVSMPDNVGPEAMSMICKSCNKQIYTRVEHKPTANTYLIAGLCCLLLCWPCACCVYCSASCRNIDHYCPNCDSYIGTYTH